MKKVFDIVYNAQSAALKAARPGVACEDVDAAARKVIAAAGTDRTTNSSRIAWDTAWAWTDTSGHILVRGNKLKLAPGMVFSDEPGFTCAANSECAWKTTCTSLKTAPSCSRRRARRSRIRFGHR
jgi:Xaa-Pro dipeptidase